MVVAKFYFMLLPNFNQNLPEVETLSEDQPGRDVHQSHNVASNLEDLDHMQRELLLNSQRFKVNRIVELTKPRTAPPYETPFNVYTSVWTAWSHWSACYNNLQMRARACSSIRGHRCPGENIESKPCRQMVGRFQESFQPVSHGSTNVGGLNAIAINTLGDKFSHQLPNVELNKSPPASFSKSPSTTSKEMEDKLTNTRSTLMPPPSGRRQMDAFAGQILPPAATIGPPSITPPGWHKPERTNKSESVIPLRTQPSETHFEKIAQPPTLDKETATSVRVTKRPPNASLVLLEPEITMKVIPKKISEDRLGNSSRPVSPARRVEANVERNRSYSKPPSIFPEIKLINIALSSLSNNELRVHQAAWSSWSAWSKCTCKRQTRTRACIYPDDAPLTIGCRGESYEIISCDEPEDPQSQKNCIRKAKVV
uniref:Uncharacterized protein n=1 Tax=Trichuris muris TaxID=70415 RepID=A0A5S6R486_TRIMR